MTRYGKQLFESFTAGQVAVLGADAVRAKLDAQVGMLDLLIAQAEGAQKTGESFDVTKAKALATIGKAGR
jgi:hypothetical protein